MTRSERLEAIRKRDADLKAADYCEPELALEMAVEDIPWLLGELERLEKEHCDGCDGEDYEPTPEDLARKEQALADSMTPARSAFEQATRDTDATMRELARRISTAFYGVG